MPTPVNSKNLPDLTSLITASKLVAKNLKKKDTVVYESTVYPGCTEEVLIPILEKNSGMKLNKDFHVGYSRERIDPGSSKYKLTNQNKIISGSNAIALRLIENIYKKIIRKKIFKAKSIKVAEAAKIIENTQRDINIAFINEISMLFHKLGINTNEVLKAANTKWNFLNFRPGLVGGHCIGVDPYYLKYKANKVGYKPKIISSGRKLNDEVPKYIFNQIEKNLKDKKKQIRNMRVLFLGITFKENCGDFRNSKAISLYEFFNKKNKVDVFDNLVNKKLLSDKHKIKLIKQPKSKNLYDIIIVCVPHTKIKNFSLEYLKYIGKKDCFIADIKSIYPTERVTWQL